MLQYSPTLSSPSLSALTASNSTHIQGCREFYIGSLDKWLSSYVYTPVVRLGNRVPRSLGAKVSSDIQPQNVSGPLTTTSLSTPVISLTHASLGLVLSALVSTPLLMGRTASANFNSTLHQLHSPVPCVKSVRRRLESISYVELSLSLIRVTRYSIRNQKVQVLHMGPSVSYSVCCTAVLVSSMHPLERCIRARLVARMPRCPYLVLVCVRIVHGGNNRFPCPRCR